MKSVRKGQKFLGCIVTLGGCVTAGVIMLVGGLLVALGVVTSITPLIIVGAIICAFSVVCFVVARLMADAVNGPK